MDEVSLDTLLLSGECDVQWGTRGTATVHRTVELHANDILYLFEEPKNSMAKHIREKVYVEGCRVVDGGAYAESSERLLLVLANHDYAEKVDLLGNRQAAVFAVEKTTCNTSFGGAAQGAFASALPSADYVVQLFLSDKMAKWRLLQAIQRASKEYPQLFPDSAAALAASVAQSAGNGTPRAAGRLASPTAALGLSSSGVENRFESKVLGQSDSGGGRHSRTDSGVSVLSDHEVLQLADVLREYEAMQESKRKVGAAAASLVLPPLPPMSGEEEDRRKPLPDNEDLDTAPCAVTDAPDPLATTLGNSKCRAPARLQHSPLYEPCVEAKAANQICADCSEPFPSWCILQPFGAFVCIQCIGVHRKLWSNKCRGAELDLWPAADVEFMKARGNDVVNDELEYYVAFPAGSVEAALHAEPAVKPVLSFSSVEVRESFIQWKYEDQLFTRWQHPNAPAPLPPRPDPVGLEHSRFATAATGVTEAEGCAGDTPLCSPAQQQQQQQQSFLRDQGPPRYAGLLDIIVKELVGPQSMAGAVCVLTNGFQTLRTHGSRELLHMRHSTAWDEHLQLGVEAAGRKPLYCTIYRGRGELLATAEVWMTEEVFQPGASCMFASDLRWSQLHKRPSQRSPGEQWKITFLTSYQLLA
ncbi:GTP-ase activating protein [Novymonas esmeraldas]|uniref:GTP-ase activating protein n=1 Tax=Novymonas esmeraldas TaxID=1808958 RepID=A0AAW0EW44_9TRYP